MNRSSTHGLSPSGRYRINSNGWAQPNYAARHSAHYKHPGYGRSHSSYYKYGHKYGHKYPSYGHHHYGYKYGYKHYGHRHYVYPSYGRYGYYGSSISLSFGGLPYFYYGSYYPRTYSSSLYISPYLYTRTPVGSTARVGNPFAGGAAQPAPAPAPAAAPANKKATIVPTADPSSEFQRQAEEAFVQRRYDDAERWSSHALVEDGQNGKLHLFAAQVMFCPREISRSGSCGSTSRQFYCRQMNADSWWRDFSNCTRVASMSTR